MLIVMALATSRTLPKLRLAVFQGELDTQWHFLLAMTVMPLPRVVIVFGFLQKYVTTGMASTGLK
jgi:alpha-1,4-digalacturonate transport system permease protein